MRKKNPQEGSVRGNGKGKGRGNESDKGSGDGGGGKFAEELDREVVLRLVELDHNASDP